MRRTSGESDMFAEKIRYEGDRFRRKVGTETKMLKTLCCAILLLGGSVAQADVFYSNETAWLSAVPGATQLNFNGITSSTGIVTYGTGAGATTTLDGVTYTAVAPTNSGNYLGVLGGNVSGFVIGAPTLVVGGEPAGPASLLITLPFSTNALGFVYDGDDTSNLTVTLSDGTMLVIPGSHFPTLSFFGVTSATGLTSVEISNAAFVSSSPENAIAFSEVDYGPRFAPAAVPEPGYFALFAAGIAIVVLIVRRRQPIASA
jgi:hypothetical protein